jgi:serine/threonine protein kinase
MQSFKLKIFLVTTTLMLLNLNHCLNMNSELEEQCPKYSFLYEENHKTESEKTKEPLESGEYFRELTNLENFVSTILEGEESIGEGSYGNVFPFDYIDKENNELNIAAKIQKIIDTKNNRKADKKQKQVAEEIKHNKVVYDDANGPYFFTNVYDSFEFTELADERVAEFDDSLDEEITKVFSHGKKEGLMTIFMERLDVSFLELIDLFFNNEVELFMDSRVDLYILAMQGLEIINKHFLHCDVKPENIMLKKISPEKAQEMVSKNFIPIRTGKTFYYQLKYIDFGLIAQGKEGERKCHGGTPGYIPKELDVTGFDHEKFDVFSLGMTFLFAELAIMELEGFDRIQTVVNDVIDEKDEEGYKFTKEQKEKITNLDLYNEIDGVAFREEKKELLNTLKEIYPKLEQIASEREPGVEYMDIDPEDYLFIDPYLCNLILFEGLKIYVDRSLKAKFLTQEKELCQEEIDSTQAKLDKDSSNEILLKKLEASNKLLEIADSMVKLRLDTINVIIKMSEFSPENRSSLSEALAAMNQLKTDFYSVHKDDIDLINEYFFEIAEDNEEDLKEIVDKLNYEINGSGSIYSKDDNNDRLLLI